MYISNKTKHYLLLIYLSIQVLSFLVLTVVVYRVVSKMAFTGAYLTIIYTVLLHFTIVGTNSWIFNSLDIHIFFAILTIQGLVFISYPLIGLLADIKLTRYQMICLSCWILFVSYAILSILYQLIL